MGKIALEQRSNRRYDMRLPIHYRISQKGVLARTGSGMTCEISTGGLSFRNRKPLPVGAHVEMTIEWPAKHGDLFPIDLQATGFVLRNERGKTAIRMTSRKFRVLPSPVQSIPVSA